MSLCLFMGSFTDQFQNVVMLFVPVSCQGLDAGVKVDISINAVVNGHIGLKKPAILSSCDHLEMKIHFLWLVKLRFLT